MVHLVHLISLVNLVEMKELSFGSFGSLGSFELFGGHEGLKFGSLGWNGGHLLNSFSNFMELNDFYLVHFIHLVKLKDIH